jgi:hypothetical protein
VSAEQAMNVSSRSAYWAEQEVLERMAEGSWAEFSQEQGTRPRVRATFLRRLLLGVSAPKAGDHAPPPPNVAGVRIRGAYIEGTLDLSDCAALGGTSLPPLLLEACDVQDKIELSYARLARALMKKLAPGDVVITPAVDRLSRDTTDLLVIARDTQRAGAGIRSLAEPFLDTTSDFAEIIFAILGVAAKLERRRILERTARGRADAKEKGVKFGRKPTLTPHQQKEARKRLDAGETQRSVARSYNVSQSTISRLE